MLGLLFAALAALTNAGSSVLQRRAAMTAVVAPGRSLIWTLLHRGSWIGGFGMLILGFLLQAAALSQGSVATVQPVLAAELPFTLVIASFVLGKSLQQTRRDPHPDPDPAAEHALADVRAGRRRTWIGAVMMAAGLAIALFAASPSEGHADTSTLAWVVGVIATLAALGILAVLGVRTRGSVRAAFFGLVSGGFFGLTAVFMATVTLRAQDGVGGLFGAWQLYAMIVGGFLALYVLQHAYEAGSLAASQPGITIFDPVVAVVLGIALFDERIRGGWWILPELIGVAAVVLGAVELSRSPVVTGSDDKAFEAESIEAPSASGATPATS